MVRGGYTVGGLAVSLAMACTFGGSVPGIGDAGTGGTTDAGTGTGADDGSQGVLDGIDEPSTGGPSQDAGSDDDAADTGCVAGELGCPCGPEESCDAPGLCVDGVCAPASCGNGTVEQDEVCDDGNRTNDDGCDADCQPSSGVAQVVAGLEHTCVRMHDGQVKCWGRGGAGRTGTQMSDDTGVIQTPMRMPYIELGGPAFDLCAGVAFTCAAYVDRDAGPVARCWGHFEAGKLGVPNLTENIGDGEPVTTISPIELGGTVVDLACGSEHACAIYEPDGQVRCWGDARDGRLGSQVATPVGDDEHPSDVVAVDIGGEAVQIVAGGRHTCALLGTGEVRCWGDSDRGRLGNGDGMNDIGDNEPPTIAGNVVALDPVVQLAAGNAHTCALLENGAVKCWGGNGAGQLGYGDKTNIGDNETLDEVDVVPIDGTAVALAAGWAHTCAVLQTGELRCWGEGAEFQLGEPAMQVLSADEITVELGERHALHVAGGDKHTCVRVEGGSLYCFGSSDQGQLGYGPAVGQGAVGDDETPLAAGPVPL